MERKKIIITRNEEGEPTGYKYVPFSQWLIEQSLDEVDDGTRRFMDVTGPQPPKQARLANPDWD